MDQFIPMYNSRDNLKKQSRKLFQFGKDIKELIHQKHHKWTRLMEIQSAQDEKEYKIS